MRNSMYKIEHHLGIESRIGPEAEDLVLEKVTKAKSRTLHQTS